MEQEEKGYPFAGASIGGMTLTPLAILVRDQRDRKGFAGPE